MHSDKFLTEKVIIVQRNQEMQSQFQISNMATPFEHSRKYRLNAILTPLTFRKLLDRTAKGL